MHVAMEMTFDPGTYTSVSHHTLIFVPSLAATNVGQLGLCKFQGSKVIPGQHAFLPPFIIDGRGI